MDDERKVCGNCIHHEAPSYADGETEWLCDNEMSEAYGLQTEYGDRCEEWEG